MTIEVASDQAIINEATHLLMRQLPASSLARLWSAWHLGQGDYSEIRQRLFQHETVDSLAAKIRAFERDDAGESPAGAKP